MRVTFGLKAHSGWAALVVVGRDDKGYLVVDRRRIDLVDEEWAKQPYHAAENLQSAAARKLVKSAIALANRIALREIRQAVQREEKRGNEVVACGVLMNDPMPDWSVDEILAVHFRMHKAEGVLFRNALARAAEGARIKLCEVHEKQLWMQAERRLKTTSEALSDSISMIGKTLGAPWGKDQKEAALSAMIALNMAP